MDSVSLFYWALADLEACTRTRWHYHQVRIAGIIRLLVMDRQPLATQVNHTHRIRLRFEHGPGVSSTHPDRSEDLETKGIRFALAELDQSRLAPGTAQLMSSRMSAWLKVGALRVEDMVLSAREFVQHLPTRAGRRLKWQLVTISRR